jgi:hypothetical protein
MDGWRVQTLRISAPYVGRDYFPALAPGIVPVSNDLLTAVNVCGAQY